MRCHLWPFACACRSTSGRIYEAQYPALPVTSASLSAALATALADGHDAVTVTLSVHSTLRAFDGNVPVRFAIAKAGAFRLADVNAVTDANGVARAVVTASTASDAEATASLPTSTGQPVRVNGEVQAHFVKATPTQSTSNIGVSLTTIDIISPTQGTG